jgi:hypothetical protein
MGPRRDLRNTPLTTHDAERLRKEALTLLLNPDNLLDWLLYAGVVFVLWEIGAGASERGPSLGAKNGRGITGRRRP